MGSEAPPGELARLRARVTELESRETVQERELERARALAHTLRTIIDLLPHRIFWKDRSYRFLGCNLALARDALLDSPEQIVGKLDAELPWRDHAQIYRADDIAVIEEGRVKRDYEEPLVREGGERMWLRTTKVPLRDEHGTIVGIAGYFEDLTEQHAALRSLRESEERYRSLLEQAQDAIFLADRGNHYIGVNSAGCILLGYTRAEILGQPIAYLIDPEDLAQQPIQEPFAGERLLTLRRLRHKDGSLIPVEIRSSRLPDGTFEAIVRDIRSRTAEEEQRKKLEEELQHAQKMESIGRLAGGIAHDFNNLLLVILANAHLLKRKELLASTRELDGIVEASERASRLTRQLLSFSRKRVLKPDVLDLNEVVRGMSGMFERVLGENIELRFELSSERCMTLANAGQLEQVLMNLTVNARDAIRGSGRVTLRTEVREPALAAVSGGSAPAREVVLRVEDTGHGMDAATLARVFEPFFTTKGPGDGTGLGLAMVYGIVTQNGGTIAVESEPGRGTTFEIHLPVTAEVQPPRARPRAEQPGTPAARTQRRTKPACVLLVEDDDAVRETLEHTLTGAGYTVLAACGGEEALQIARANLFAFDVLLSDVVMSSLSGPLVAERLLAERVDLPVLLMSGYSDKLFSNGLDERLSFLEKPFTPEALLTRLAELLR